MDDHLFARVARLFFLLISVALLASCAAKTPPISAPGVASLEKVRLGGVDQWILIRGKNANLPVLLFIHGGPGSPEMPLAHRYGSRLEEMFVVVHWDQRGAGKSYRPNMPGMTVEQFLADASELTALLKSRFHRERIYLVGHSWGSLMGALLVARHPEDYLAYVGIGQVVDMKRNEEISYRYTVDEARRRHDLYCETRLKMIGPPPYAHNLELSVQRDCLVRLGGALHDQHNYNGQIESTLTAPEYSPSDVARYLLGEGFSIHRMWGSLADYNLIRQVPRIEVPVYFAEGRYDYNTPWELVQEYYNALDAPRGKTLVWFEHSAHSPNLEEPEEFARLMERVVTETNK